MEQIFLILLCPFTHTDLYRTAPPSLRALLSNGRALAKQPVAKTAVGRRQQRGLVVNQMIGQRTGDGLRQRINQPPLRQRRRYELASQQRHPHTGERRLRHAVGISEHRPTPREVRRQPHGLTPQRPVFTMFIVQQRILQ